MAAGLAVFGLSPMLTAQARVLPPAGGQLTWSQALPRLRPPPLEYASAVYDSDNGTVVLFGGVETNGDLSDTTWVWAHSDWTAYSASQIQAPPAREMASMAFDPELHKLILFGGQGAGGQLLDDTWAWNGASWYQLTAGPDDIPSPRQAAGLAYDRNGSLVLFGGTGYQSTAAVQTSGGPAGSTASPGPEAGGTAETVGPALAAGTAPGSGSSGASGAGSSGAGAAGAAGGTGAPATTSGASATRAASGVGDAATAGGLLPAARPAGGRGGTVSSQVLGSGAGSSRTPARKPTGTARSGAGRAVSPAVTPATSVPLAAAATASTPAPAWAPLVGQPVGPDPALGPAARASGTATLATGAVSAGSGTSTPTDLAAVSSAPAAGIAPTTAPTTSAVGPNGAGPLVALGDTWLWTSSGWVEVRAGAPAGSGRTKPSSPPARSGAAMSYDSATGDVVLFSGESGPVGSGSADLLSDTWLWNGSSWSQPKTKTEPPPRSGGASTDDPNLGGVLLLGGSGATGPLAGNWVWSDNGWSKLSTTAAMPPLEGLTAAFSSALGEVVAFGGATSGNQVLGDTFLLGTAQQTSPGSGSQTSSPTPTPAAGGIGTPPTTSTPSASSAITPASGGGSGGSTPATAPLTIDLSAIRAGGRLTLSGGGFRPGTTVSITFHSKPDLLATVKANAAGRFTATVTIPAKAAKGTHHLMASGLNAAGRLAELEASVRILGGSGSSGPTAVETGVMLAAALGIPLAAWLSMSGYAWIRRKNRRPASRPV